MTDVIDRTAETISGLDGNSFEADGPNSQNMTEAEGRIKQPGDATIGNGRSGNGTSKWGFQLFSNSQKQELPTKQTTILETHEEWLQDAQRTTGYSDIESVISEDCAMGMQPDADCVSPKHPVLQRPQLIIKFQAACKEHRD